MTFILSPAIIDEIIFAMENQTEFFLFDALEGMCVGEDTIDDAYESGAGGERYYNLPEWSSAQGFRVMEQFTTRVHNPLLRESLQEALRQRKGVFRRYKAVLKAVPAVEHEWYRFKDQQMKAAVYEWYNELRMIWGLEKIGFEEETDTRLLPEDFTFQVRKLSAADTAFLSDFIRKTAEAADLEEASVSSAAKKTQSIFNMLVQAEAGTIGSDAFLIVGETFDEPCAVCLIAEFPSEQCCCIPLLRVLPEYRGLGLGKELLQRACAYAGQTEARVLLFADLCTPSYFITELERNGFGRTGLLYAKDIISD